MQNKIIEKKQSIFKSKPFFKKIDSIDSNFISKYIFFIFMICVLSIASALLMGFGFSRSNDDSVALLLRAISIFCCAWLIVFFIWWIEQTHYYLKLKSNKSKWLEMFSFLPVFNLISLIRLSKEITNIEFKSWLFNLFSNNSFENSVNNYFTKKWYLNLSTLIVMTPLLVLLWWPDGENIVDFYNEAGQLHNNMWFEGFHFFTIQTNLLCYIYLLIFVINPRIKLFDTDNPLICLLAYLFIVAVTYDFVLLPTKGSAKLSEYSVMKWVKICWEHMVNPIMFITVGIYNLFYTCKTNNKRPDYLTILKFGMIIPSIYLCYVLVLPFVSYDSVYGSITNANPNPHPNLKNGAWYKSFFILGYWFVFIAIITMFWRIKYSFYAKNEQKIKNSIQ